MTAAGHPKIPVIPVIAVMPSGKTAPASTERMDNRYSAIRACLFLQDETGSDVAAGIPHGFNLVPTWDEVADARYCGAGLWRWQNNRTAFYPINGTDAADFTDGKRVKIALTPAVELSFLKKGEQEQPLIFCFRLVNAAWSLQ